MNFPQVQSLYYLTLQRDGEPGEGSAFATPQEIQHSLNAKAVTLHSKIRYRFSKKLENGPAPLRVCLIY